MRTGTLSFLTESSRDFKETATIGGLANARKSGSFDTIYENTYNDMKSMSVDPMFDINTMIKNPTIMDNFKSLMLESLMNDCDQLDAQSGLGDGHFASIYEQVDAMFDNATSTLVNESASVGQLLPIKAMDYPILIKQHLKAASKEIMQTEVTKTPIVKKHIERTWVVDPLTGQRWEYPQCFFNDDFKDIYKAGKGLPISNDPVDITSGLFNYHIPSNLTTAADPTREHITIALKIIKVIDENDHEIPVNIRINLADGSLLGGKIDVTYDNAGTPVTVQDFVTGHVDFVTDTVSLSSAAGKIKSVVFDGFLSNEKNERSFTLDYTREEKEWTIEDGARINCSYSIEQLENAKALVNLDLYKKTYDNIGELLYQMEDSKILEFLDTEFDKYDGVEVDPLGFNSFIEKMTFDCDSKTQTVALPSEYIHNELKFAIDNFLTRMMDTAKMENMTFVLYGNPRYIALLGDHVNWIVKSGDMMGGVKLNYSYGVMTTAGIKVQVVSAMKIDAATDKGKGLRIIPYPLSEEQMTFKQYKFTTHILTQANSGYRDANLPGGSMTNIMGTSRYTTASVQGIQGNVGFDNLPRSISR